jgi:hypothetical protein
MAKIYSLSSAAREMQDKTTVRYHVTPLRMPIIKETINNTYWQRCGRKQTSTYYWWEFKLIWPLRRTICRFLTKRDHDTAIPLQCIYTKKTILAYQIDLHDHIFAALFTITKPWNHSRSQSMDEHIKRILYIYIYIMAE